MMFILVQIFMLFFQGFAAAPLEGGKSHSTGKSVINVKLVGCSYVPIVATLTLGQKTFEQTGIGWLIQEGGKNYLLAPSHVVDQAAKVRARCNGRNLDLKLVSNSPTLDLALFQITSRIQSLKPIDLNQSLQLYKSAEGTSSYILVPDKNGREFNQAVHSPLAKILKTPEHQFPGVKEVLELSIAAIKPGFSGSPVLDYRDGKEGISPIGMMLKTEINGSSSLALSIKDISEALPLLIRGEDPWRSGRELVPFISFELEQTKLGLQRNRVLNAFNKNRTTLKYLEKCNDVSHELASSWTEVSQFSTVDSGGSGDHGDSGGAGDHGDSGGSGDHGDGGGTPQLSDSESEYSGTNLRYLNVIYSFFKRKPTCMFQGLKTPEGKVLVGVKSEALGIFRRVVGVEDIFDLAYSYGRGFPEFLGKYGVYQGETIKQIESICQRQLFLENGLLKKSIAGSNLIPVEINGVVQHVLLGTAGLASDPAAKADKSTEGITCDYKKKRIQIIGTLRDTVMYIIFIEPEYTWGGLFIGDLPTEKDRCVIEFGKKTENQFWNFTIDRASLKTPNNATVATGSNEDADFSVSLNPTPFSVKISINSVGANCQKYLPGHTWLILDEMGVRNEN